VDSAEENKYGTLNLKLPHYHLKLWKLAYHLTLPSCSYVRMLLPELYTLQRLNAPTSSLDRARFVYRNSHPHSVSLCKSL